MKNLSHIQREEHFRFLYRAGSAEAARVTVDANNFVPVGTAIKNTLKAARYEMEDIAAIIAKVNPERELSLVEHNDQIVVKEDGTILKNGNILLETGVNLDKYDENIKSTTKSYTVMAGDQAHKILNDEFGIYAAQGQLVEDKPLPNVIWTEDIIQIRDGFLTFTHKGEDKPYYENTLTQNAGGITTEDAIETGD